VRKSFLFGSLYAQLASVLLGLFVILGVSLVWMSVRSTDMYQQEVNQKLNRGLAELIVKDRIVMEHNLIKEEAMKDIFHMLMVINPSIEVYLLDPAGKILAFSADPGKVKRKRIDLAPLRRFLGDESPLPILGDDPRSPTGRKVFSVAPVLREGRLQGYLYVILGGETYDTVIQKLQGSYIFRLSVWIIAGSLFVTSVIGLVIFASLTRRLRRLAAAMESYTGGMASEGLDLPQVRQGRRADEIDSLVSAFHKMSGRIREQVESLKRSDAQRRELVANVSHDLRTPLAALQGYLETLLMRDDMLPDDERRNYLASALRHCERLSRLIAGLFELAKLEAQDAIVQPEPFNVAELVQDVVQKFELEAARKNISLTPDVGAGIPFVTGDIALIERVIENLIDNAIRYTPEGGAVRVGLDMKPDSVSVTVGDTGSGISAEELPRIFERFYRADRIRRDRSGHSGLGLAIAKRILELHRSTIEVESREGKGTVFTFDLPFASRS
jgi:two-component system OmpR family sensor kinase